MESKDIFQKIYEVVRQIPNGRVTNYGAIARYIGSAKASRMVGYAMNSSHTQKIFVPAHRVVNRVGILTGKNHFGGHNTMKELLESEGAIIEDDRIMNFKDVFWDPNRELRQVPLK